MKKVITKSDKETLALGEYLAKSLHGGEVLALYGDLGAGKTVLAKGIAKGLGIREQVNSPTFNIMKVYPVRGHKTIKSFCHVDAYRLHSGADLEAIGLKDYFKDKVAVILIEWAEKIEKILPKNTKKIKLKHISPEIREIRCQRYATF